MAMQITATKRVLQRAVLRMLHADSNNSLPTNFFQKSLPYLPLPTLEESISLYLDRQKSLHDSEVFKRMENLAKSFVNGHGQLLQKELVDSYSKDKYKYFGGRRFVNNLLRRRYSIIEQTNAMIIWKLGAKDPQLLRASKIISSFGSLLTPIREHTYEPIVMNYNPLFEGVLRETSENRRTQVASGLGMLPFDMKAHANAFSACRIPGIDKDTISSCDKSKNILIIRNGHLFSFDVLRDNGEVISLSEIHGTLKEITELSYKPSPAPIAALTILDRPSWAKYRNHLATDSKNAELLKIIDEAILVMSLDKQFEEGELEKNFHLGIYPGDRWFDKSSYMCVDESSDYSAVGGNGIEAHAVVGGDLAERAKAFYEAMGDVSINSGCKSSTLKHLKFNVDDHIHTAIKQAEKAFYEFHNKFQCKSFARKEVNSREFKKRFLNPSAMVVLGLQIALIKMYNKPKLLSSVLLTPNFINSHTFDNIEPTPILADIAQKFVHQDKLEMSSLRSYSDASYSNIIQMRMGHNLFTEHLMALINLSLEIDQPSEFLNSQLFQDSIKSYVNITTFPQKIATNMVFSEFHAGLALTYLFNDDGMYGGFMSLNKGPPMKEYSNLFFETMEQLVHKISS